GPLPNQVLLSHWFDRTRGRAMGVAYLGIGIGGALVPFLALWLTQQFGWRLSLHILGGRVHPDRVSAPLPGEGIPFCRSWRSAIRCPNRRARETRTASDPVQPCFLSPRH